MKFSLTVLALAVLPGAAFGQFQFRDVNSKSLELSQDHSPVFVFNYGTMLKAGVPADRARCCYLHPVYAPTGAVITDDFPDDHHHHRGISWMWLVVIVDGKTCDLWTIKGILARFEKWDLKEAGSDRAVLAFTDGWYVGDRKVVEENIAIVAHAAAGGRRDLDFTLRLRASGANVSIAGTPDLGKGYGGFNIRFAPRTGTVIDTAGGANVADSDLKPNAWAELRGDFAGKPAATRIIVDASNPQSPYGWCLRQYGFLGVDFPGLRPYTLPAGQPLVLKFRVSLSAGDASRVAAKKVLVYTRNHTPDGKGYVHDNIQDSVNAIRKMGAENGFSVDATDDPVFFTDATLQQYQAVVFANSNDEAFAGDAGRQAFRRYIEAGHGFIGIHSAAGSERSWPYYWSILGGSFLYHPKLQRFLVRVADPGHPATRELPATFEWEDECYHLQYLNPNLHALLVTDPAKLDDPRRARDPFGLVGTALPLAWTLNEDGGREFYTSLGHQKEHYQNPILYRHILGGILWAMGERK